MKKLPPALIPVNQRDLAAYLNISRTLMSMTNTGRHGSRKLGNDAYSKLTTLIQQHLQLQSEAETPSLLKSTTKETAACALLAKTWSSNEAYAQSYSEALQKKLEQMRIQYKQDVQWLKTVDRLLEQLPHNNKEGKDRPWFKNQQVVTMARLKKNGPEAQAHLQLKMELEKAKAAVYKKMKNILVKK